MILVDVEGSLGMECGVEGYIVFDITIAGFGLVEIQARFNAQQAWDLSCECMEGVDHFLSVFLGGGAFGFSFQFPEYDMTNHFFLFWL